MEFEKQAHYPIFLKLENFSCLVIGGGKVAARKISTLVSAGAKPHIVATKLCDATMAIVRKHNLQWQERAFQPGDTRNYQIVIAATNSSTTNNTIANEALASKSLVNNISNSDLCNFILPATLNMPPLQIAISTMGQLPMLSHALKQHFAQRISAESIDLLNEISHIRQQIIEQSGTNEQAKHSAFDEKLKPLLDRFIEQLTTP